MFLNPVNPITRFLRSRGAVICTTSELEHYVPRERSSTEEITNNRNVLEAFFGQDQIVKNVESLVAKIRPPETPETRT